MQDASKSEQVLQGMKVLDLTHYVAGPFCTKLLADFGADVIKVERPGTGDKSRQMGPFPGDVPHPEKSGLFLYLNTNKRGITLNLKTATGKRIFKELVRDADALVENFSPRVMPALGLDYESLKEINPHLVMTSVSNFGQTGPYRDYNATEIVILALSGHMSHLGDPAREPLKYALNAYQYFAGETAAMATIAAAIRNFSSAVNEHIDVSIHETIVSDINSRIYEYSYSGYRGRRTTVHDYPAYPWGGFRTRDGYVAIQGSGAGERWLPRIFAMIDRPDLVNNPKFANAEARMKNIDEFNAVFYGWLAEHTKQEVFDAAAKARYPIAAVYNTRELVDNPHYRSRGFFVDIDHPVAGRFAYPGAPVIMSEGGYAIRRPAPLLGEHNAEIYGERLGYSAHDISLLRRNDVI